MSLVSLIEAKKHLRVEIHDDDEYIALLIDAAEQWAAEFLNRPLSDLLLSGGVSPPSLDGELQPAVKMGVLVIVGDLYENREQIVTGASVASNSLWERILYPYRVGLGV